MTRSDDDWEPEPEPDDAREVYEKLLSRLDHNTGGYQPPLAPRHSIFHGTFLSGFQSESVQKALTKARIDGHLFRWEHPEEETYYLGIDDAETLHAKAASYGERREDLRKDLLGITYKRINHLEDET